MSLNFWRLIRFVPIWRGHNRSCRRLHQRKLTKRSYWKRNRGPVSGPRSRNAQAIRKPPLKVTLRDKTVVKSYIKLIKADSLQFADKKSRPRHDDCLPTKRQTSQTTFGQSIIDRICGQLCGRMIRRIKWPYFVKLPVERWMRTRLFAEDGQIGRLKREYARFCRQVA